MQLAGEYWLLPPLIVSACIRARFAARICDWLMVCADAAIGVMNIIRMDDVVIRNERTRFLSNPSILVCNDWHGNGVPRYCY